MSKLVRLRHVKAGRKALSQLKKGRNSLAEPVNKSHQEFRAFGEMERNKIYKRAKSKRVESARVRRDFSPTRYDSEGIPVKPV